MFQREKLRIEPDAMKDVLAYHKRLSRRLVPDVESEVGPAVPCALILDAERLGVPTRLRNVEIK